MLTTIQTVIVALVVFLIGVLCFSLYATNREVRNLRSGFMKTSHDLVALQDLLSKETPTFLHDIKEEVEELESSESDDECDEQCGVKEVEEKKE